MLLNQEIATLRHGDQTNGGVPVTADQVVNEQVTRAKNFVAYSEGGRFPKTGTPPHNATHFILTVGLVLVVLWMIRLTARGVMP